MQCEVLSVVLSSENLYVVFFLNLTELLSHFSQKSSVSDQETVLALLDDVGNDGFEAVYDLSGQRGVLRQAFALRGASLGF